MPAKSHPSDLPTTEQAIESEDQLNEDEIAAEHQQDIENELEMDEEELEDEEDDEEQVDVEAYESSSSASTSPSTLTWISWYVSLPGHEYFCEVAEDFIEDDFNLTGLQALVPFYKEAMEMVLDVEAEDEAQRVPDVTIVESSAELLYGLIHQRFIITRQGLQQMYAKYDAGHFGLCPRVYCTASKLVPCGRSDLPGVDTVKLYCSSCVDMYVPPSSRFSKVDGAFFGTTFPHLLFQTYPSALPFSSPNPAASPVISNSAQRESTTPVTSLAKVYIPRIYGFKVSERAKSGPRMQWLRMRPRTEAELDWRSDDDLGMADGAAGNGAGGPTEKFEMDGPNDDDDEESEEEEEDDDAAGGGGEGSNHMEMSGIVGTPTHKSTTTTPLSTSSTTNLPTPSTTPAISTGIIGKATVPPRSPARPNPPSSVAPPRPMAKDVNIGVGLAGPVVDIPNLSRPPAALLVSQKSTKV